MEAAVSEYGANKAFTLKLGDGEYRDISYSRYYEEIRCLGEALLCRGFSNTRIVIIGKNSYNWISRQYGNFVNKQHNCAARQRAKVR